MQYYFIPVLGPAYNSLTNETTGNNESKQPKHGASVWFMLSENLGRCVQCPIYILSPFSQG